MQLTLDESRILLHPYLPSQRSSTSPVIAVLDSYLPISTISHLCSEQLTFNITTILSLFVHILTLLSFPLNFDLNLLAF